MKVFVLFVGLSLSCFSMPDLGQIVPILKQVESLGDNYAIGDNGKAYGVLQIHKVYVEEVNRVYNTHYSHVSMFEEYCAEEVFYLYMEYASKRFIRIYKRQPTEEDIVRMHNGGMYKGHRINATLKYYRRYLKFKNRIKNGKKSDNRVDFSNYPFGIGFCQSYRHQ